MWNGNLHWAILYNTSLVLKYVTSLVFSTSDVIYQDKVHEVHQDIKTLSVENKGLLGM